VTETLLVFALYVMFPTATSNAKNSGTSSLSCVCIVVDVRPNVGHLFV